MSTGSELREPGMALGHDSIYDANSYMLAAAARAAGAIAYRVGIVPDDAPVVHQRNERRRHPRDLGVGGHDRPPGRRSESDLDRPRSSHRLRPQFE